MGRPASRAQRASAAGKTSSTQPQSPSKCEYGTNALNSFDVASLYLQNKKKYITDKSIRPRRGTDQHGIVDTIAEDRRSPRCEQDRRGKAEEPGSKSKKGLQTCDVTVTYSPIAPVAMAPRLHPVITTFSGSPP